MVALIVLFLFGLAVFLLLLALRWRSKVVLALFGLTLGLVFLVFFVFHRPGDAPDSLPVAIEPVAYEKEPPEILIVNEVRHCAILFPERDQRH